MNNESASQRNPPENSLKCPTCGLIFKPDFDPETHSDAVKCPRCSSWLPFPLDKCIVNRKPKKQSSAPQSGQKPSFRSAESLGEKKNKPQQAFPQDSGGGVDACTFFFGCSVASFIAGDIAAIFDKATLSSSLYWTGVSFILMAIYLKIKRK